MTRSLLRTLVASALAAFALVVAGCGGDDDKGETGQGTTAKGKQGGKLTYLAAADVDFMDPGQTYYSFAFMVQYATQRTLYSFRPEDSVTPVPDLAEGEPEISADSKTVTVKIKKGIRFSPPVDREVTSKDVKYAFERAFTANVPSGYATTYFGDIVGAPATPGAYKPIPGIETPDDSTIVFKLERPVGVTVASALVLPISVPVPQEYAEKFDRKSPSTYDGQVVFTGPYMVRNDSSGKLVGRRPGKRIELVRNPSWDKATDYRPAYLDAITIDEGNSDLTVASRRVLNGQGLACCDAGSPPAPVLKQALQRFEDQVIFIPSGGTRYVALNTTVKPFDDLDVRKAVLAVFDRNALRLTRGGAVLGDIASGWLPPGIPGFEEAGGLEQGTKHDFLKNPKGDLALAQEYMRKAGYASGKYTGEEKLLMVATNADPGKKTAEVSLEQFRKLGFKINFRVVPQDTLYTKFCNVPKANVAICPNVGWFKDFVDPQSMLDATFNGAAIRQQNNSNWSELDVPAINEAMKEAATVPAGTERNEAWAKINDMIIAQAPAVPWIWDKTAIINSGDVQGVGNGYTTTHDLSFTSLK